MNFLKLSLFSLLVIAFASCNKDDDSTPTCTQSDWVGTYEGTVDCDGTVEDVTVTITASGTEDIVIVYETSTVNTEYSAITPSSCDVDETSTDAGITFSVDATLDGDDLTLKETFSFGGGSAICNITATRK